jgi:hypothetical protein
VRTLLSSSRCRTFLRSSVTVQGASTVPRRPSQSRTASRELRLRYASVSKKLACTPLCAVVVQAFERLSGRSGKVLTGAQVVKDLSRDELRAISAMTRVPVLECVGRELSRARSLHLVASPGQIARERYYVSIHASRAHSSRTGTFFLNHLCLPSVVRIAVDAWWDREQRPFRANDIQTEVMCQNPLAEFPPWSVGHRLHRLAHQGVVAIVGRIAGIRHGGASLFVPSRVIPSIVAIPAGYTCVRTRDVPPEVRAWAMEQVPSSVLPWPERCQRAVCACWAERLEHARRRKCKPTAIPTCVIVERLRAIAADGEAAVTPERVASCLKQAANEKYPRIGRIRVPGIHTSFWIGIESPAPQSFTLRRSKGGEKDTSRHRVANVRSVTDVERVAAVLRAHERETGRPAATILELRKAISIGKGAQRRSTPRGARDIESGQRPRLERLLGAVVSCAVARYSADEKHATIRPSVRDLGRVGAHAYYATGPRDGRAEAYVAWLRADQAWKESGIEHEIRRFPLSCESIPLAIAIGRTRRMIALLGTLNTSLTELGADPALGVAHRDSIQKRLAIISDALDEYTAVLSVADCEARRRSLCLPNGVEMDDTSQRLFGSEIYDLIAQFTGPLQASSGALPAGPQACHRDIRFAASVATSWFDRQPNTEAWKPQSKRWRERARVHYDQFKTYTRAAALYGGPITAAAATLARTAAGPLRDARFALLALQDPNQLARLQAVAALAYLSSGATVTAAFDAAGDDPAPGVRRLAAWARGFVVTADWPLRTRRDAHAQDEREREEYAPICSPIIPGWVKATLGASTMAQAATPRGWWSL